MFLISYFLFFIFFHLLPKFPRLYPTKSEKYVLFMVNHLWQDKKKTAPVKGSDMKRTRSDRGELEDIMFKLFERQPNWALKQLVQETDQPAVCLLIASVLHNCSKLMALLWNISLACDEMLHVDVSGKCNINIGRWFDNCLLKW